MTALVQFLQGVSGTLWLVTALFLSPRIVALWRPGATRTQMLSAPVCFMAWLMAGFAERWLVWRHALASMDSSELLTWAALYLLSAVCAVWIFLGALETRGE